MFASYVTANQAQYAETLAQFAAIQARFTEDNHRDGCLMMGQLVDHIAGIAWCVVIGSDANFPRSPHDLKKLVQMKDNSRFPFRPGENLNDRLTPEQVTRYNIFDDSIFRIFGVRMPQCKTYGRDLKTPRLTYAHPLEAATAQQLCIYADKLPPQLVTPTNLMIKMATYYAGLRPSVLDPSILNADALRDVVNQPPPSPPLIQAPPSPALQGGPPPGPPW